MTRALPCVASPGMGGAGQCQAESPRTKLLQVPVQLVLLYNDFFRC